LNASKEATLPEAGGFIQGAGQDFAAAKKE
jgi:hypothetical protein